MKFTSGYGWIRILFDFNFSKRQQEPPGMLEPYRSLLYGQIESIQNEKNTKKKQRKTWAMPEATFHSGWTLTISLKWLKKDIIFYSHQRKVEVIGGGLREQEAELGRLAPAPSYLTEVMRDSLNQCQLRGKWTSINPVHSQMPGNCWLLWFRVETFPSKTSDI